MLPFRQRTTNLRWETSVAFNLDRILPDSKPGHEAWRAEREIYAQSEIENEFTGRNGKSEKIHKPSVHEGQIACGSVSGSEDYNKKIKSLNRKILAIDTESGGLFAIAKINRLPALSVRGISDYAGAGIDKNVFEIQTNNKARLVAAANAASFLARQLGRRQVQSFLIAQRDKFRGKIETGSEVATDALARTLIAEGERYEAKLRDLAPSYPLQAKGYRIPVPRVRLSDDRVGAESTRTDPIEIRDAIRKSRVIILQIPPQYPDLSLAWIVGRDLLLAQIGERQLVPCVIDSAELQLPKNGIRAVAGAEIISFEESPETHLVFVIDDFNFGSRTRTNFLVREIESLPNAKFLIVTRNKSSILTESDFTGKTAAVIADVCDVSFLEIALFLQKNFEMAGPAAEVVASRLRDTFDKFKLPVHPTYFAGIPGTTLSALLQANRRAELIELAVAGYLSYVVSQDDEPVALSRTTREKFLAALVFEISVEKRSFSEPDLIKYADAFAKRFDFPVSPTRFVATFIAKGILHFEADKVRFTLPFMESYLLAKRLNDVPDIAMQYFNVYDPFFDVETFTISAELGMSNSFVSSLLGAMDVSITTLKERASKPWVLAGDTIVPPLLEQQDRLAALEKRLHKAVTDVINDEDKSYEKQKLLDAYDRVREHAARMSEEAKEAREQGEQKRSPEGDALSAWTIAVLLLGAGAERLEAETKRALISKIITLASLIADDWTREVASIDFAKVKTDLLADGSIAKALATSPSDTDLSEAERTISGLVDVIEYTLFTTPFRSIMATLSEEARDKVLAQSIANTQTEGTLEKLVRGTWLSDIDTPQGSKEVREALKKLPRAKLLRVSLAAHLIMRVYWKHWNKDNRLTLLALAGESLKGMGVKLKKSELERLVDQETKSNKKKED